MRTTLLTVLFIAAGCGPQGPAPTDEQLADATTRVQNAMTRMQPARDAVHVMGVVPVMPCGAEYLSFLSSDVPALIGKLGCATVTVVENEASLKLDFGEGCNVKGRNLSGAAYYRYSGTEAVSLELDLTRVSVDGTPVPGRAGYTACTDKDDHYFAESKDLRACVIKRDGAALMGTSIVTLDVDEGGENQDVVRGDALVLAAGHPVPNDGTMVITTTNGRRIEARFRGDDSADLTIDDLAQKTVVFTR